MPIPNYETFMLPVLRLTAGGAKNVTECLPALKTEFGIRDEEAEDLIPGGRLTILQSRAHWTRTYLGKAGLLESPKRNLHIITARGREVLASNPERLDNTVLARCANFREWKARASDDAETLEQPSPQHVHSEQKAAENRVVSEQTPEDAMAAAHKVMNAALRDDLLALL